MMKHFERESENGRCLWHAKPRELPNVGFVDYVKQVGGMVQPGTSAVLALVSVNDPHGVADKFRGYGGTVLKTRLGPAQATKVQETLKASKV
jgi:uncharacterized membrane protein